MGTFLKEVVGTVLKGAGVFGGYVAGNEINDAIEDNDNDNDNDSGSSSGGGS